MSEETNPVEREYTQEELTAMRLKTINFYKEQETVLQHQCVVEELKARVKIAQFQAFEATIKMMQLNHAIHENEEDDELPETTGADHDIDKKE
jgi:Tfp pilus assembly protein FimV